MHYTTYAIGDVHGRADLLLPLLEFIDQEAKVSGSEPRVIFLGDIVDRGPSSREAMDLVCDTVERWPRSRLIRGNHDAYILDFMTADAVDETKFDKWLMRLGGYATLSSYDLLSEGSIAGAAARFRAQFARHLEVLREAVPIVIDAQMAYVHAGISPSRVITDQDPQVLMMIREGFLDYEGDLSHVIVHGHTVTASSLPEQTRTRISIDTGAYATGRLTCLAASADETKLEFLTATENARIVHVTRGSAC